MSRIRDVLSVKGDQVQTISETSSLLEAVRRMNDLKIGSLIVMGRGDSPCGIVTERDVVRTIATVTSDFANLTVGEVMTKRVIVCGLDDQTDKVWSIMKNQFVRQLPVVADDGTLLGIVSLGDTSAHLIEEEATEIKYLHDYIHGDVR